MSPGTIQLGVNIDHVATLREARYRNMPGEHEPDPVRAAHEAELGGADGITIHLREDRRHIQDRDVRLIREVVRGHLNLEMAATDEMVEFALDVKPEIATLVPEKREELTTEGGLDVVGGGSRLTGAIERLAAGGITVSLFIDADADQIRASKEAGATEVELHTGPYDEARTAPDIDTQLEILRRSSKLVRELGLVLNAGHGLNYHNVQAVAAIQGMGELNVGHSIISRAVFTGLPAAVHEMNRLIREADAHLQT